MSLSEFEGTQDLYVSCLLTGSVLEHHKLTSRHTSLAYFAETILLQNESGWFQLKDGALSKTDKLGSAGDRSVVIDNGLAAAVVLEGDRVKSLGEFGDVKLI